jgi:ribosomal protein L11 methyltransferase
MDTIEIKIAVISEEQGEILISELSEVGFHGFLQDDNMLFAFIKEDLFQEDILQSVLSSYNLSYVKEIIADINWNEKWEREFEPVVIDSFVAIRAPFHSPINGVENEIIIIPKMSFGTGHHATTKLMLKQMILIDFKNKSVLDFGTGTGVLAILASKLGAASITAVDNDQWSIKNARENILTNKCNNISLLEGDSMNGLGTFEIILANINLNVIKSNIFSLKKASKPCSKILLSGFLLSDESEINGLLSELNFQSVTIKNKEDWICAYINLGNS